MQEPKKFLSTLGLCVRAGKVIFGVPQICEAMRKGGKNSPVIVFEAADTSENTHKRISDKCTYYNIEHRVISASASALGAALGRSGLLAAVGITDENLKRAVEKQLGV